MSVNQTGEGPHVPAQDGVGLTMGVSPPTILDIPDNRLPERRPELDTSSHQSDGNCRSIHIMNPMRRSLVLIVTLLVACGQAADPVVTTAGQPPTTTSRPATTTSATQALEIHNCASPPVTFSALCEVYELVQEWHVDRPILDMGLADIALRALHEFAGKETEPRPRTLICSVPNEFFTPFCEELAQMVHEDAIAVGPAVDYAVTAMADLGLDPYSYYVPPDQVGSVRSNGILGGVGLLLDATDAAGSRCARITEVCPLRVVFVLEDNPGADAGLQAGDVISAIDGVSVEGQGFSATATRLAGDETGRVELTVERGGQPLTFDIERAELKVPTVVVDLPRPGVGYIRIPDFEDDIPGLVHEALTSISEFDTGTLVVDLRDNPGGLISSAVDVASEFVSGGLVLETFGPDEHLEYEAEEGGLATQPRLLVLVNAGSASAAEVLAGALRDRRSATIVGTTTFGKDTVQIPFKLRNGGEFYVAVARWLTPNGLTAGDGGLRPDRELEFMPGMTIEDLVAVALAAAS